MHVAGGVEQLFFVTAFLTGHGVKNTGDQVTWWGTGFVYAVNTTQGQAHFLVSNKHVLNGKDNITATSLTVRFLAEGPDQQPAYGQSAELTVARQFDDSVGHPNPHVDVAVMPLEPIAEGLRNAGQIPFLRGITENIVLSQSKLAEQARAIEDLIFIGYPGKIYDTVNLTPIARRGITATPLALDYRGTPAYLIDGAVFEGSSGSPVFIYGPPPPETIHGISFTGHPNRIVFSGVLASVHVQARLGELVDLPTAIGALTEVPMGLGIVFKPWTIDDTIDAYLDAHGLRRIPGSTSTVEVDSAANHDLADEGGND